MTTMAGLDLQPYWDAAFPWETYRTEHIHAHEALWDGVWTRARVPAWAVQRGEEIGGRWRMLVISEDWCGDASNTLPVLARLAEALPTLELRVARRDENPELMDEFLTDGARSIPIAVLLRDDFTVAGHWGPRPAELQAFTLAEKRKGERSTSDIYRDVRRWYARDRGETTIREVLDVMAGG